MAKPRNNTARVVDLDTPIVPQGTMGQGHNADTLSSLIIDIDALHTQAVSLVDNAVSIARRSVQYLVGPGNGNSQALARLTDTMEYLGKRGLVVKLKAWINETCHFEYAKTPDGKASYRKAKKKDALAIFNATAWEQGFHEWTPEDDGKEKEEWTIEAHIRRGIKRIMKDFKLDEAQAREVILATAKVVPLVTIVVPESTQAVSNVGAPVQTVDTQANEK